MIPFPFPAPTVSTSFPSSTSSFTASNHSLGNTLVTPSVSSSTSPLPTHVYPSPQPSPYQKSLASSHSIQNNSTHPSSSYHHEPPPHPNGKKPWSLSDFLLLQTIGTGTFGRVHLARLMGSSHYFAIKILEKAEVVRLKQVEHIQSERDILMSISHPFVVNLYTTFQTKDHLYLLLEYACGGELFSHLRRAGRFSQDVARFYSAEITLALAYLHEQHIVYRDLKPENLLLDYMGHIKLADFGFSKVVYDRTWTLCGTPEYLAPEIIQGHGHATAVDWWALGILIFEMLAGYPPFYDDSPYGIYEKILSGVINFPLFFDYRAMDLISKLLRVDRSQRLGNLKSGATDVKNHSWFKGVDWKQVSQRSILPPIIPNIRGPEDTRYFESYDEPSPFKTSTTSTTEDPFGFLFTGF